MRRGAVAIAAMVLAAAAATCSKKSGNPAGPSAGCTAPATSTTITIANNAVCPQNVTVPLGSRVLFINNDTVAHEMYSDPHPEHTDCPELGSVGHLEPGQRRETGNLVVARRCGFHDHLRDQVAALRGSITAQ